jgi:uncharacterized cupredoxin-like copper-binding protein
MVIVLGACGGGDTATEEGSDGGDKASRSVMVTMRDDLTYEPARIEVREGESIKFVVVNKGGNRHEFLIGDENKQQEYEQAMRQGGHEKHGHEAPGVNVEPGKEKSFVFTVPRAEGRLFFGCHEPGHYQGGMKGEFVFSQAPPAPGSQQEASPREERHH